MNTKYILAKHKSRYEKNFEWAHQIYNDEPNNLQARIDADKAQECIALLDELEAELLSHAKEE